MRAVQISETGGPEVMQVVDVPIPEPGPGEVIIEVGAAGLNFIDTYHRSGVYPVELPMLLGKEAAGTISSVGEGVERVSVGDRVMAPWVDGGYGEYCVAPGDYVYEIPDDVGFDVAAAAALQGLTAHYLATWSYPIKDGDQVLIHAGAGGVGGLLIQIAKNIGAEVFTTVGTMEKAEIAKAHGADHVIVYTQEDFGEATRRIIGEDGGLNAVYDGVGKTTFDTGLGLLRSRGTFVLFGGASGQVPAFDLQRLNAGGSLFITRPSLSHHIPPGEGHERAAALFRWIADGALNVSIGARFSLEDAADAHRALEGRATTGKVLILP